MGPDWIAQIRDVDSFRAFVNAGKRAILGIRIAGLEDIPRSMRADFLRSR